MKIKEKLTTKEIDMLNNIIIDTKSYCIKIYNNNKNEKNLGLVQGVNLLNTHIGNWLNMEVEE